MGRRRANKRHVKFAQNESQHAPDPLSRSIAAHPNKEQLALAVGPCVRIVDVGAGGAGDQVRTIDGSGGSAGEGPAVRVVQYSPDGALLMTAGDERLVRLWDTSSWECIASWKSPKKVSAGTFTADSRHLIFADKYGDVLICDCSVRNQADQPQSPSLLLGHLCSVVASLIVSPDCRYLVSTDKDRKVRVSLLPDKPLLGSVEIQSYCLGHTYFVSSCAWGAPDPQTGRLLLVTGSGDGSVRLWDPEQGTLLDTLVVSEPEAEEQQLASFEAGGEGQRGAAAAGAAPAAEEGAGCAEEEGEEEEEGGEAAGAAEEAEEEGSEEGEGEGGARDGEGDHDRIAMGRNCAPVTCVSSSQDRLLIATLVEGRDEVLLVRLDPAARKLSLVQQLALPGVRYPSGVVFDCRNRLWATGGPPLHSSRAMHVGVAQASGGGELVACTAELLPAAQLEALEQRNEEEEKQVASGALVPAFTKQLTTYRNRAFTAERLSQVKRQRRDFRESERLREMVAAEKSAAQ